MKLSIIVGLCFSVLWVVSFDLSAIEIDPVSVSNGMDDELVKLFVPYAFLWFLLGLLYHREDRRNDETVTDSRLVTK